ncbi:hypothetical protein [uncultured Mucilaginibacter sp.]|uniref:hypothetical protein n=1 Tax=uncultured Mucilaginibacter sp. TaxID=797541 RepID=UPI0025D139B6|nr:hypothetical protein [uncultured Mucilaginibacter sp.]
MKKLSNINPFILLLVPVVFALILGVSYQFEQAKALTQGSEVATVEHTTSLFSKGVHFVKAVCAISQQKTW